MSAANRQQDQPDIELANLRAREKALAESIEQRKAAGADTSAKEAHLTELRAAIRSRSKQ